MSLDDCARSVADELGISRRDAAEILERLKEEKTRATASGEGRPDERLKRFAAKEAEKARIAAELKKRHAAINAVLKDEFRQHVEALTGQGLSKSQAVLAYLVGTSGGVRLGRHSVAATRVAYEGRWLGGMMKELNREVPHVVEMMRMGITDVFAPGRHEPFWRDVVREMFEHREGGNPGVTGSKDALRTAQIVLKYEEASRLELNKLGAHIGKLDGRAGPQNHDVRRMLKAGPERWIDAVLAGLDVERTFPDLPAAEVRTALGKLYREIVTGADRVIKDLDEGARIGPANLARSLGKHRFLHFKDADAWIDYARHFADGNVLTAVVGELSKAARHASLMARLGPNPQAFLDARLNELGQGEAESGALETAGEEIGRLRKVAGVTAPTTIGKAYAVVSGATDAPYSLGWAMVWAGVRAVVAMAKLGAMIFSNFSDLGNYAHAMRFQGKGLLAGYGEAIGSFADRLDRQQRLDFGLTLGAAADAILGDIHARYDGGDVLPGWMSRLQTAYFQANLGRFWQTRLEIGFARGISAWMAQQAAHGWNDLPPAFRHVLGLHGLDEPRWEIVRKAVTIADDGRAYVFPETIAGMDDDLIRPLAEARLAGASPERAAEIIADERGKLELMLRSYFADETSYGVLKGDDRTRMYVTQGQPPGTGLGEMMRFLLQFKSFPIAYTQKVLGRAARGGIDRSTDWGAVPHLIAASLVLGYVSMTAKDIAKGNSPKDPKRWETMLAAMAQGGGLGIYGDYVFGKVNRYGGGIAGQLPGPAAGQAADLVELWLKVKSGDAKAGDALRLLLGNVPFLNLFYLRPALDLLVLNQLQEWASPGTFKRREAEMRKEFGQERLWNPLPLAR